MAGLLGSLVLAAAKGKEGWNQGKEQAREMEAQQRREMLTLLLADQARKRAQANADRSFGLQNERLGIEKERLGVAQENANRTQVRNIDPWSDEAVRKKKDMARFEASLPSRARAGGGDGDGSDAS